MECLEELPKSINIALLIGHGTIRAAIMGFENRNPSDREMKQMEELVNEAMKVGAFGLSTGLIYTPGVFSSMGEIVKLAKIVSKHGGFYASHIRNESDLLVKAVEEAVEIGRRANLPVQISHHKASGMRNWGLTKITLSVMNLARREGIDVLCDVYPYTVSMTSLIALLPPEVRCEDIGRLMRKLQDKDLRKSLIDRFQHPGKDWENILFDASFDGIILSHSKEFKEFVGKSIAEISRKLGVDPFNLMFDIIVKDRGSTIVLAHGMCEEDLMNIIKSPLSMIGSDGKIVKFKEGMPHPRSYGTFPRVIARYVKERKIIELEEAIRKMTSMPALRLGLLDRGILRPGAIADIVILDYWRLRDRATYQDPHRYPMGIEWVIVNGVPVVKEGKHTGAKPGVTLRRRK